MRREPRRDWILRFRNPVLKDGEVHTKHFSTNMRSLIRIIETAECLPLNEGMALVAGLALYVFHQQEDGLAILYDPSKTDLPYSDCILATASFRLLNPADKFWIIGGILAKHGYGPLMYAIAAEIVGEDDGMIIPSDIRSTAAKNTWKNFEQNPYVSIFKIADRDGRNGPYNPSPTGFGIRGNGSLDITSAVSRDAEIHETFSSKWHDKLVATAIQRMKRAVNR